MSDRDDAEARRKDLLEQVRPTTAEMAKALAQLTVEVASESGFEMRLAAAAEREDAAIRARVRRRAEVRRSAEAGRTARGPIDENARALQPEAAGRQIAFWRALAAHRARRPGPSSADEAAKPQITQISRTSLSPGDTIGVYGFNLGEQLTIAAGDYTKVSLNVTDIERAGPDDPSIIYLEGVVPPDLTQVHSNPESIIWSNRSDGQWSNFVPIAFEAAHEYWYSYFDADLKSSFGLPGVRDGVVAEGQFVDRDQTVAVTLMHKGDGWSELRAPMAGGQSLAQGFHIGNAWFEYSQIRIFYQVTAARGFPVFNASSDLPPWTGPSPVPWVPWF